MGLPRRHRIPGECNQHLVGSRPGQPLDILFNNINDWSRKAAAFFLQRRPRVALFVEHHLAASSLPREKELWERHGYRLFLEPAQPTGNGRGTAGGTGVMCMKGIMAGEFLPLELQQIFDEAAMQAGRFWQAITLRLRRCTLMLVALYLQPNLGAVGKNMRRLAMEIPDPYQVAVDYHGRLELRAH